MELCTLSKVTNAMPRVLPCLSWYNSTSVGIKLVLSKIAFLTMSLPVYGFVPAIAADSLLGKCGRFLITSLFETSTFEVFVLFLFWTVTLIVSPNTIVLLNAAAFSTDLTSVKVMKPNLLKMLWKKLTLTQV